MANNAKEHTEADKRGKSPQVQQELMENLWTNNQNRPGLFMRIKDFFIVPACPGGS